MEVHAHSVTKEGLLGRGAYAEVYKGRALETIECAIKVYRTTATPKQFEDARREIELSASLDHPCRLREKRELNVIASPM